MRSPIAPNGTYAAPSRSVAPVDAKTDTPTRQGTRDARSFAELLADAEAVRDIVDVQRRAQGWRGNVQGALQGAATFLARQTPWMGLPLLLKRPVTGVRPTRGEAD